MVGWLASTITTDISRSPRLHERSAGLLGRVLVSEMILAPARVRNVVIAATSSGRSAQRNNNRPMSLTGNAPRSARANFSQRTHRLRDRGRWSLFSDSRH